MRVILPSLSLLTGLAALLLVFLLREKPAYVDSGKLFSEFKLSKELRAPIEAAQKSRKAILDSLYKELGFYTEQLQQIVRPSKQELDRLALMQEELRYRQRAFEEEQSNQVASYENKVWLQMNEYIKEFGKQNNYKMILGATGQGSLMYADEQTDITSQVLEYINDRYDGKNKK